METSELFVAGSREKFSELHQRMGVQGVFGENSPIRIMEAFRAPGVQEKQRGISGDLSSSIFEVALHWPNSGSDSILRSFARYARSCGARAEVDRSIPVSGIMFMPVVANRDELGELSKFSFLRVLRPMPTLRTMHPIERSVIAPGFAVPSLPNKAALDPSIRTAIFDGGLPPEGPLKAWADGLDADGVGPIVEKYLDHGHMVTSAALFGPLKSGQSVPQPYASVDHYRVLDENSDDPYLLYDALERIRSVLEEEAYDFVNLSLGPSLPIEDDEVHPWTAVLDEYLSRGKTLLTVAAGNNGDQDRESGNARVQVPSDCVNAIAVGAADSDRLYWERADYSAIGPGRSPGLVKPDVLTFGGAAYNPFHFVPRFPGGDVLSACGTSFAAPAVLRIAAGIRAHFGGHMKALALKALLVHCAQRDESSIEEAGWGRIPDEIEDFVVCKPNSVRVLYQGDIEPSQVLRMPIPLPEDIGKGDIKISATYCINSPTDSRTPNAYTGSAIHPLFRPHAEKMSKEESVHPATTAFFQNSDYMSESELRHGAHKWETVKHKSKTFRASSLLRPVFDVRHLSRIDQLADNASEKVEYALVVTISSKDPDIYNKVVRAFGGRLEILQPQIEVPISLQP
ncbi:S8 family peptidase [Streptomyces inhibens]|uniref:S8 family peptidase n=1 Tax=Streptomyces inhibens TaxID=2293571 RepID=UPI001EE6C3E8|nr:S8 family peptidase [Streptomyces inhibens]UKY50306.1 S8 family peptidase [Streptomyces inhibens]